MTSTKKIKNTSRFLRSIAKLLTAIVVALLVVLLLLHVPPIQQFAATRASKYLSAKTNSTLTIDRLGFSIWGELNIDGILAIDPNDNHVLSVNSIQLEVNPFQLLRGDFHIKRLFVNGLDGYLRQTPEGLNIDYFIRAFNSQSKPGNDEPSKPFAIHGDLLDLQDINFTYESYLDSFKLTIQHADIQGNNALFNTSPGTIAANSVRLDSAVVDITMGRSNSVNQAVTELQEQRLLPKFNFDIGYTIDVKDLGMSQSAFSYHVGEVTNTSQLDGHHLDVDDITISATDLRMHEDAIGLNVDTLTAILPVIERITVSGQIAANLNACTISELSIRSANSTASIDLTAEYPSWYELIQQLEKTESEVTVKGILDQRDLSYFLPDSLMTYLDTWDKVNVDLIAQLDNGFVRLKKGNVEVSDSYVTMTGNFRSLEEGIKAVRWDAVNLDVSVGSAFHNTLMMFADSNYLPDSIHLQVASTGIYDNFKMTAQANTNWGTVKANGRAGIKNEGFRFDMAVEGHNIRLNDIANVDFLDKCNFSLHTAGTIDDVQSLQIDGTVHDISIVDQVIHNIALQSRIDNDSVIASISILDSNYRLNLNSDIFISDQVQVASELQLEDFRLGKLLNRDSNAIVSGSFYSEITISDTIINGLLRSDEITLEINEQKYTSDTLDLDVKISPSASQVSLLTDDITGSFSGNFDLREVGEFMDSLITENFTVKPNPIAKNAERTFDAQLAIKNDDLLQLVDVRFEQFEGLTITTRLDQKARTLSFSANTGPFEGLGMSCDTISFNFLTDVDELTSQFNTNNILYDSIAFGDLKFQLFSNRDSSGCSINLLRDSAVLIDLVSRLSMSEKGLDIYPDRLVIFDQPFNTSWNNPVFVSRDSFSFDQLKIGNANKELTIDGNVNNYDITLRDIQLAQFNHILARDTALIKSGRLSGNITYDKSQQKFDGNIHVDSLRLATSDFIQIDAEAHTDGSSVPFNISLSSKTNNLQCLGNYQLNTSVIDATLHLDLQDAQLFDFTIRKFADIKDGSLSGDFSIKGPLSRPDFNGELNIKELKVVASGTESTVNIKNQQLKLNDSGLKFENFTIYDQKNNPLVINGAIKTEDYKSIEYDLNIITDNYILFNQPRSDDNVLLRGVLVVASDIKLTGNHNNTHLDAKVTVKDTSNMTFVMAERDIEIITDEGIVQFVDPNDPHDSVTYNLAVSFYDSIIAMLPSLDLRSVVKLEKNAVLKVIVDPRAGDYIEVSGEANLELKLDRTGNLQLNGDYAITNGIYQLSFYGIAKKKFEIKPESKVRWNGNPKNGDLNVVAIHRVKTSSTGLIGNEVGENEQSIYRKALDYEVGIVIKGTIEKPEISFTLDLPAEDKVNYPALANKLSRLGQPEFESELNKQVFGLLVLGGFLPEDAGADVGELAVATTLSNSVSSILTSQLNRFVNDNIEGLEFDVGMQTYSDNTSGGNQTRTAMDFRVTKRMMDDRLSFEVGAEMDLNADQSGASKGQDSFRGDVAVIYDLTESGNKKLKAFNNETYDIIYHEIRNTGIAFILIKEFDREEKKKRKRE